MGQVYVRASRRAKAYTRSSIKGYKRLEGFSSRVAQHALGPKRLYRTSKRQKQLEALLDRAVTKHVNLRNTYYKKKKIGRIIFGR